MFGHKLKYNGDTCRKKLGFSSETRMELQNRLFLLCERTRTLNADDLRTLLLFSHRVPETHSEISSLLDRLIDVEGEHLLYKIGSADSTVVAFINLMYANNLNTRPQAVCNSFFDYLWYFAYSKLVE